MTPLDCFDLYEDAEFYDMEFATREFEIPFFRKYARKADGPILEIACGTGRITLPIARDGIDITGLDVSPKMLERAGIKSAAECLNIEWIEQDCRDIRLPREFGLIFSATNAMQHLLDLNSVCAFLQSTRHVLQRNSLLILDVFNPDPAKLGRVPTDRYVHKTIESPDGRIRVETASEYHPETQILHFDLFYLRSEQLLRTKHVNMRCFFPEELLAICRFNGFEVVRRFGDYDESDFRGNSPKQILLCRKIEP